MSTKPEPEQDEQTYQHPIDDEIVAEVAYEHEMEERILHTTLELGDKSWDGYREDLVQMSHILTIRYGYDIDMRDLEEDEIVIGGHEYTPLHLLENVDVYKLIENNHYEVSVLRLTIAVTQAHKKYAKQKDDYDEGLTSPVVISVPPR